MENLKKPSLKDRIVAFFKDSDESKITRFTQKLQKYFTKQINMRKESIENLKEKIVDATETLENQIVEVKVDQLNSTDGAEGYCSTYVSGVSSKLLVVEGLEDQIKVLEAEVERFEKLQLLVFGAD